MTQFRQDVLIRQLQGALGGNRVIAGRVTSAGSVEGGTGFSVAKNGTGDYTITFTDPFSAVPSFTATTNAVAARNIRMDNAAPSASAIRVVTAATTTGAATDSSFHFHAIGPP